MKERSRLAKYLDHMAKNAMGWKNDYENCVMGGEARYARLAGHYNGMLDDLIRLVGYGRVLALVSADDAVDEHVARCRDCGGVAVTTGEDAQCGG